MPYPYDLSFADAYRISGNFSPDPSTEFSGGSLEDFYDYLTTPRHQREMSQHGAITHYGPSRYASISPEDAAMAEVVLNQIEAGRQMDFAEGERKAQEERRRAADQLMSDRRRERSGGGGTISFSGSPMESGGFAGPGGTRWAVPSASLPVGGGGGGERKPLTEEERMILYGGGYSPDPITQAESQGKGYPRSGMTGPKAPTPPTANQQLQAQKELDEAAAALKFAMRQNEIEPAGGLKKVIEMYKENPASVPDLLLQAVENYMAAQNNAERYGSYGQVQDITEDYGFDKR